MASTPALTRKAGPVGGLSGLVRDMDITGVTRIVKISVQHSINIDAISVTFLRNGVEESTGNWGGGAQKSSEFYLNPSEYITNVKGHIGQYQQWVVVKSLTFETNIQSYGPFGSEEGDPFELPAIGGQIIGFHGRAGGVIDAIGVYIQVPTQVLIQKIGPVGGQGGTGFDMDTNGISRIVKIRLRVGGVIDGFGVSFIRDGREEIAGMWGGSRTNLVEFQLQPSEYITSVKGQFGEREKGGLICITSLTFETNLGSFGPYGRNGGVPFEFPAFGGQIIGFHGTAGDNIDRIGVYVKGNPMTGSSSGRVSTVTTT